MNYTILISVAISIFTLVNGNSDGHIQIEKPWDYLTFNQNWLPAVCNNPDKQKCHLPANLTTWTIHGVWPDVITTKNDDPFFCDNSWHFNVSELQPIITEMNLKWPSDAEAYKDFWKHEWQKHGTCAAQLDALNTIKKYFATGLEFADVYNLDEALQGAGIVPDDAKEIEKKDIDDALAAKFGKIVLLQCTFIKGSAPLLTSIDICIDKQLHIMDCPKDKSSNCNTDTVIYLPFPQSGNTKGEL